MTMNKWFFLTRRVGMAAVCACAVLMPPAASAAEDKKDPIGDLDGKMAGARITRGEAMRAALKEVPGKVTDVTVERKRGKQVYVIEIVAEKNGKENDVLVDMQTGVVLGIDD